MLKNTPLPPGITLNSNMSPKTDSEKKQMEDKPYHSILESVMWGQLATHPDLLFSVLILAHFQADPGIEHRKALMHVIGYIKNTIDYGLTYSHNSNLSPHAYVDADYGGCKDTWQSTSRYVFIMAGGPVTWSSKCQATVTLSTIEAKYVAMSRCTQQMVWMHSWLDEVEVGYTVPGLIRGDNQGMIALTKTTKDHGKVKHIDIWHHYIQELLQAKAITIEQVSLMDNLANLFTKSLPQDHHHHLLSALNICWALLCSWGSVKLCLESAPDTWYLLFYFSIILLFILLYPGYHINPTLLLTALLYYTLIISCITYSQSFLSHPTESKSSIPLLDPVPLLTYFFKVYILFAIGLCTYCNTVISIASDWDYILFTISPSSRIGDLMDQILSHLCMTLAPTSRGGPLRNPNTYNK